MALAHYMLVKIINYILRGNGVKGQDISYMIPYLNIPILKKKDDNIVVRGELIMSKNFQNINLIKF